MNFADSLKAYDPEGKRREVVRQIEEDPRGFAQIIADYVEKAVKRDATAATKEGRRKISGYLITGGGGWDSDVYYCLLPEEPKQKESQGAFYITIDRVNITESGEFSSAAASFGPGGNSGEPRLQKIPVLSQRVADFVCSVAKNKLEELGFQNYAVTSQKREFYYMSRQTTLFGRKKLVPELDDAATLLWIEVGW